MVAMTSSAAPAVVGVPRETKPDEHRVAVTPDGVRELARHDVTVVVEAAAGADSGFPDADYAAAGAAVVATADEVWARADLICKVKEPQPEEWPRLRPGQALFTYLHLAAYPEVGTALLEAGVRAIGYETVQLADGTLPLLAPMSEVAGRLSVQVGAHFLERPNGGSGVLLGGAPGVAPARVVVLGAGNVGWNAAWIAAGMEAEVRLLDLDLDRLRHVDQIHRGRITTLASNRGSIERAVRDADLVIGAVLVAGGRAPVLVDEATVASMRPSSVIVDVAVDQGGCIATTVETSHHDPVRVVHGVLHYGVGNIPAAVPHTSTHALCNATLPHLVRLAAAGVEGAIGRHPELLAGCNTWDGAVVHPTVAAALGVEAVPFAEARKR